MNDTPQAFVEELRSSLLNKRVGQIALAVVLTEAAWRLVVALTWYLIIPDIGRVPRGSTESVLFAGAVAHPLPLESLFGSLLEFGLVVILVFYLNRWVQRKPTPATTGELDSEYSSLANLYPLKPKGRKPRQSPRNVCNKAFQRIDLFWRKRLPEPRSMRRFAV